MQAARGASLTTDGSAPDAAEPQDGRRDDGGRSDAPAPAVVRGTETPASRTRSLLLLASTALVALALDVVTKVLVVARIEGGAPIELLGGQLLLRVTRNPGAAFSFAQGATAVFTVFAVVVIVVIARLARRLGSPAWALSLGLLLGGAAGNLVDRMLRSPGPGRGAVVDFIDFQVWPSFNVADSAIVIGALLAVVLTLRGIEIDGSRPGRRTPADGPSTMGQ